MVCVRHVGSWYRCQKAEAGRLEKIEPVHVTVDYVRTQNHLAMFPVVAAGEFLHRVRCNQRFPQFINVAD